MDQAARWCLPAFLSLERLCHDYHSQMHSKKEHTVSQHDPGDPQTTVPIPSFHAGALLCPPGSTQQWRQLLNLQTLGSNACKNLQESAILVFPVSGFREVFLLCNPLHPAFSLCVSLSILRDQGSLLSTAPVILSSLESCLCTSYLPQCGFFCLSSSAACSLGIQIEFLGVWNDMIFI